MRRIYRLGFILALLLLAAPTFAAFAQNLPDPVDGGAVEIGDDVEGELTLEEPAIAYTLEAVEGQSVTITLTAEDFDCYLTLLDEDGNEVAFDDDSAGNLDSRVSFSFPDDGTYTIVAQSYSYRNGSSGAEGDFTLAIREVQVNRIEYSQRVTGTLTSDQLEVRYLFTGQAGDTIVSEHFSDDYDSYLILERSGNQLTSNDDGAGNLDSRIGPFALPETGEYTLVVTSLSRSDTGSYEVTLNRVELETIEFGDEVTGELTERQQLLYYQFSAQFGDTINVLVDSEADTELSLMDPSSYQVISDQDSGSGRNPEITDFSVGQAGLFTLIVRSQDGSTGEVTLSVERVPVPSLSEGPQSLSFSSSLAQRGLVFDADAGTTYRITLDVVRGDTASPSLDITQFGTSLGYTSTSSVSRLSIDITPSSDGEVLLRFSEYSYRNITIEVTLEEIGGE